MTEDSKHDDGSPMNTSLGVHLASIRQSRGYSLRKVEELTGKDVSNAYLSQIESGKIEKPSPSILYALSKVYRVNYDHLMKLAGHAVPEARAKRFAGRGATFAELDLTEEEERELLAYLEFRRDMKKKNDG